MRITMLARNAAGYVRTGRDDQVRQFGDIPASRSRPPSCAANHETAAPSNIAIAVRNAIITPAERARFSASCARGMTLLTRASASSGETCARVATSMVRYSRSSCETPLWLDDVRRMRAASARA